MTTPTKNKVLFVDDDAVIRTVLKSAMSPMSKQWDMAFAEDGEKALALMAGEKFDLVVSDFNMPGMSGRHLLEQVATKYPDTVRMLFSGGPPKDEVMQMVTTTHRFLSKPDEMVDIRNAIATALAVREILPKGSIQQMVSQMKTLPTPSDLYLKLLKELRSERCSLSKVGGIIERDLAMSAKLLHLVNSAFFAPRERVHSPAHAASLLGVRTIRSLVFMINVFTQINASGSTVFSTKALWQHSLKVGRFSRAIAEHERLPEDVCDCAFMGGFFHDIGRLILAANIPKQYDAILSAPHAGKDWLLEEEKKTLHATHCQVGAYLLGLWGFSDQIIEAVAYHHEPAVCPRAAFGPLTLVHVANVFDHEIEKSCTGGEIDLEYLRSLGKDQLLPVWKELAANAEREIGNEDEG